LSMSVPDSTMPPESAPSQSFPPDAVLQLLGRLLSSEVKGELLMLFHRNPGLVDTAEGVARRLGRTPKEITADVEDFVDMGLLRTRNLGSSEVISLDRDRDREVQASLEGHFRDFKG
jgi:hypothetical protein